MCTSHSLSNHIVFVLLVSQLSIWSVSSMNFTNAYLRQICLVKEGSYQPGSKFEENFNSSIESLSTEKFNKYDQIFRTNGEPPNSVTIIFQCRSDSYGSKCRSCLATTIAGLRRRCQRNKSATIWYDHCLLQISPNDIPSPDIIDYGNTFSMQNPKTVNGDTTLFNKKTTDFLNKLVQKALISEGLNVVDYAGGEERFGANKLYAMVQCTKIIGRCRVCLESAIKELSKCCAGKEGARVFLGISCSLRYELYPFLSK